MEYWNEGDRVFAYWDEDEYFYPATIISIDEDDNIYVRFDTGEEEWTTAEYLDEYSAEVDQEVECKSAQDDLYYDVTILNVDGDKVEVEYENETTEWTTLECLRFYME
ncbi:MAG: agenet domain-containing protein [Anaerolineales bacterium]